MAAVSVQGGNPAPTAPSGRVDGAATDARGRQRARSRQYTRLRPTGRLPAAVSVAEFSTTIGCSNRHRIDKYLDTLLAMKSEATSIFAPQDGRWKTTVSFDGRRFCVPKFRH